MKNVIQVVVKSIEVLNKVFFQLVKIVYHNKMNLMLHPVSLNANDVG